MLGKILGKRYELLEEIGKGGMAYVYKARCVLLNRIVAVKILRDDLEGGDEFLTRFNTEAQAAASLTNSNIVSIFDVGEDEGMHYIVMEYVDGITLKEYIREKGKIPYAEALDIAYQICDALQSAHDKNIVHRDIKPHNILITNDRNIKVADFGIARSATGNTMSKSEDIVGSVHYISPEQVNGTAADCRSDIYSLGVCLYEMISGKVPFDADTPVAVAMKQVDSLPQVISDVEIPKSVHQIIFKAMSKNPDMRYQNASQFKDDILSIIEDSSYEVPDGNLYYDPAQFADDIGEYNEELGVFHKVTAIAGGCVTALLIVLLTIFFYNFRGTSADFIKTPELVGKTLEQADEICVEAGITVLVSNEVEKSGYPMGSIVSQTPNKNEKIKSGDTVKVVINKKSDAQLPDYKGQMYKDVRQELKDAGYETEINFEESKADKDTVLRQSPKAGTKLEKGETVTLYVSNGARRNENMISVPDVGRKTYKEAKEILEQSGLHVGNVTGVDSPSDNDKVISQTIPQGSKVKKGTGVGLGLKSSEHTSGTENDGTLGTKPSSDSEKTDKSAKNPADADKQNKNTGEINNEE